MDNNKDKPNSGQGLGTAGLVLGILSLLLALTKCTSPMGLVLGILGITLCSVGYTQARKVFSPTSLIMAGLIISIIGTSFSLLKLSNDFWDFGKKKQIWNISHTIHEKINESTDEFDKAFKEEFNKEINGELEDILRELEKDLDNLDQNSEEGKNFSSDSVKELSDTEKGQKLGKAAGKALKEFINEISDSANK